MGKKICLQFSKEPTIEPSLSEIKPAHILTWLGASIQLHHAVHTTDTSKYPLRRRIWLLHNTSTTMEEIEKARLHFYVHKAFIVLVGVENVECFF
jgi:hypothetical protein